MGNTNQKKEDKMKRILGAIALGIALSLSIAATPSGDDRRSSNCTADHEVELSEQLTSTALDYSELEGQLYNGSTSQSYDDVMVQVSYYNDNNEMIGTENIEVNKDIEPGEVEDISLSFDAPEDASHATWSVVCAETDHSLRENIRNGAEWTYEKVKFWD